MDAPPQQIPPVSTQPATALPPPPRSSGCGCFGVGCLTVVIVCFLGIIALVGSGWYFFNHMVDKFTSPAPEEIAMPAVSDAEFTEASNKLDQFRTALRTNQAQTFTFTGEELNALVERHPDFAMHKGKVRFAIADSLATVEMSVPLNSLGWSRLKNRWFNGSANFGFIYADEGFRFDANWLEANGYRISRQSLSYGEDSFNKSFSRGFHDSIDKQGNGNIWRNVKTMTLDEDKLVIITRGE